MNKPIAIVGAGQNKAEITAALAKQGHNDLIIMTPDEAKEFAENPFRRQYEVYMIEAPPILKYVTEKEFVCKGKHQYREVDGKWICQCGRVL